MQTNFNNVNDASQPHQNTLCSIKFCRTRTIQYKNTYELWENDLPTLDIWPTSFPRFQSVLHSVESSTNQKLFLSHVCSCYDFGPNVNRCAQLVEYAEHGREDGGLIPPDLPPQLAPHLNSDCSGELKQLTPRGVLAGVLRQLPTEWWLDERLVLLLVKIWKNIKHFSMLKFRRIDLNLL